MYVGSASIFLCEKADILLSDRLEVEKKNIERDSVCVSMFVCVCLRLLRQTSTLGQYVID